MRMSRLIEGITPCETVIGDDPEITTVTPDSRKVHPGSLFCALSGTKSDGHDFIPEALNRGAVAILARDGSKVPAGTPMILVDDVRAAMARIAARHAGDPTATRPLIGVTGTNGKTTTTHLLQSILERGGFHPAVLGTISYRFGDVVIEASHTTPESTDLMGYFRQLADAGADSFVMEVSSHALDQRRVDGCRFDVGVFTNLTRDHLDYHGDMESYLKAKGRLFGELLAEGVGKGVRSSVINRDDPASERLIRGAAGPVITYGIGGGDVTLRDLSVTTEGMTGILVTPVGERVLRSALIGRYNASNILAAAAAAVAFGIDLDTITSGIEACRGVPGRLERVDTDQGITVLVDYAHTGDALENVLSALSTLGGGRLITVFGCGGDRDRGKRPVMGEIAVRMSDLAVVTSDNPRTEDPARIIDDILEGIRPLGVREYAGGEPTGSPLSEKGYLVEPDRRRAIRLAIRAARPKDIVLIAGKGHEDYQIVGTVKHHFDDREEARAALKEVTGG